MQFQCPTYRTQIPCKLLKLGGFLCWLAFDWESAGIPEKTLQLALPLNNLGGGGNLGTLSTLQWMFIPKHSPGNLIQPPSMLRRTPRELRCWRAASMPLKKWAWWAVVFVATITALVSEQPWVFSAHRLSYGLTGCWVPLRMKLGTGCQAFLAVPLGSRRAFVSGWLRNSHPPFVVLGWVFK